MLQDSFGRNVDYLRVSVTEMCNFRCQYCMPDTPMDWVPKDEALTNDELFDMIKIAIDNGIRKIRITGGEPLIRKDLDKLIEKIYLYNEDTEITLTSNAYFLKDYAKILKDAGLKRINISLDTLKKDKFILITKKDGLSNVLEGIEESIKVGLKIKLNMVPLKNINSDEITDLLDYSISKNISLRYIEYMENSYAGHKTTGLLSKEILKEIEKKYSFTQQEKDHFGPASLFKIDNGYTFGIIQPHNDDFCKSCNRLRLTADGNFIPCLYFDDSLNIKDSIRQKNYKKAEEILKKAVAVKPEKNEWSGKDKKTSNRAFYKTGG